MGGHGGGTSCAPLTWHAPVVRHKLPTAEHGTTCHACPFGPAVAVIVLLPQTLGSQTPTSPAPKCVDVGGGGAGVVLLTGPREFCFSRCPSHSRSITGGSTGPRTRSSPPPKETWPMVFRVIIEGSPPPPPHHHHQGLVPTPPPPRSVCHCQPNWTTRILTRRNQCGEGRNSSRPPPHFSFISAPLHQRAAVTQSSTLRTLKTSSWDVGTCTVYSRWPLPWGAT